MSIIITPGETALINAFATAEIKITIPKENLDVGDVHITKNERIVYIFERKAKGDLAASINDGRYREQKSRLIETGVPRKNIIYIIEQLNKPRNAAEDKKVWSAICNTTHRDGFAVFQTKSIHDTVTYLAGMAAAVQKIDGTESISEDVNVNIKKRQVSSNEWFKYALTLVPGCSVSIANVITEKYKTISELVKTIEDSSTECLADLRHGSSKRRVGKKLSTKICDLIVNNY